jgi:hypothetical protein
MRKQKESAQRFPSFASFRWHVATTAGQLATATGSDARDIKVDAKICRGTLRVVVRDDLGTMLEASYRIGERFELPVEQLASSIRAAVCTEIQRLSLPAAA